MLMAKPNPIAVRQEEDEHAQVRRDLIFVITLNAIFLAVLIGLFFYNRETGAVDGLFSKLFHY